VTVLAAGLAWLSARPYAGGWNDGSRLATVECLVDHHTLVIDHSVFVEVPQPPEPAPYPSDEADLLRAGTGDKLYVQGHYYSDKSAVPAVLMAGVYQVWQWLTGATARSHPHEFCWLMTLASSGMGYCLSVLGVFILGQRLGLGYRGNLLFTASFALSTVALPYARQVNSHILLLAVTSWLAVQGVEFAQDTGQAVRWNRLIWIGFLAGLGYTLDLGTGPVLFLATALLVVWCCRRASSAALFLLAALPWLVLHHGLNYRIGGSWRPANSIAEYLNWPGSPFSTANMTGGWAHANLGSLLRYAASMLFGKRGFIGHNVPLYLVFPAAWMLLRGWQKRPEVLWALACCGGTWLLYAVASNNSSGQCLSIRWFLPLLAPGFLLVGTLLREEPRYWTQFAALSAWGFILFLGMGDGPWIAHMVPGYWFIQVGALATMAGITFYLPEKTPALSCSHSTGTAACPTPNLSQASPQSVAHQVATSGRG
jgi:hypothetical protein